jgi:hypothetical protein
VRCWGITFRSRLCRNRPHSEAVKRAVWLKNTQPIPTECIRELWRLAECEGRIA